MSGIGGALTKQVGPLPLGVWLLVGGGGLFIAYRQRGSSSSTPAAVAPAPAPSGDVVSQDNAPLVLSPIFRVPSVPATPSTPQPSTPTQGGTVVTPTAPAPAPAPPRPAPRPTPTAPKPAPRPAPAPKPAAPKPSSTTYTVRSGDTLSGIGARYGVSWHTIYADNRSTIEAAAKRYGHSSSNGGNLIFPGTTLVIHK